MMTDISFLAHFKIIFGSFFSKKKNLNRKFAQLISTCYQADEKTYSEGGEVTVVKCQTLQKSKVKGVGGNEI